jgi:hypothetical protein
MMIFTDKNQLIRFFEDLQIFLDVHRNKIMSFKEDISGVYMNYDRHFTTSNRFTFKINSTFSRFSGARFGIVGINDELYEIDMMKIHSGEIEENTITIIEALSKEITRKSIITIV